MQYNFDERAFIAIIESDSQVNFSIMSGDVDGEIGLLPKSALTILCTLISEDYDCAFEARATHGRLSVRCFEGQATISALAMETGSMATLYLCGDSLLGFQRFLRQAIATIQTEV